MFFACPSYLRGFVRAEGMTADSAMACRKMAPWPQQAAREDKK
jgi:hypothetical protein